MRTDYANKRQFAYNYKIKTPKFKRDSKFDKLKTKKNFYVFVPFLVNKTSRQNCM